MEDNVLESPRAPHTPRERAALARALYWFLNLLHHDRLEYDRFLHYAMPFC